MLWDDKINLHAKIFCKFPSNLQLKVFDFQDERVLDYREKNYDEYLLESLILLWEVCKE